MVYLDNNATTRIAPEVFEAMKPYLTDEYGNAASVHSFGSRLMHPLDLARERLAGLIGAGTKDDLTFTSGGTESNNAVIRSVIRSYPNRKHIVTTGVEHSSVGKVVADLEKHGYSVTRVPVDRNGNLDIDFFKNSLKQDTALVTIMWANNETGVISPVEEISKITREKNILFHCDAVQAAGKVKIDVQKIPVDYLSVSAHKLHGPKGIGLLYVRACVPYVPFMLGGAQQNGRRAGTENIAGIVGFGAAADLAGRFLSDAAAVKKILGLRDKLEREISKRINGTAIAGGKSSRVPNTSQIIFENVEGEALLQTMSDSEIYASGGSTCTAGTTQPSHVILAMGFSEKQASAAIRFSLSRYTTEEEVKKVLEVLPGLVARLRSLSSVS
ncbi:MAG: aminotransferase class V-fold PLP-dependent enzyme [Candidatus Omnitrophica bacterium]|nr:aminotransferase class V-fold PLP-dependent enzyme [Candidatus Omnitrophota bacterium]